MKESNLIKHFEDQTLKTSEIFKKLLVTGDDTYYFAELETGLIININDNFIALFGYESDEVIGKTTLELRLYNNPDDRAVMVSELKSKGFVKNMELQTRRKNGDIFTCALSVNIVQLEKPYIVGVIRDITERKQAEIALRDSELKFRTLFDTAEGAVLLFTDGGWVDCNAEALNIFGCTREQILGEHPIRFSPLMQPDGQSSDEEAVNKINLAYTEGPQFFEWVHCRADGTLFSAEVSLKRLDLGGKPYIQAIVRDVTERKQTEKKLEISTLRIQALLQLNQMTDATLTEITDFTLEQAVQLTQSKIGYLAFLNADESIMTMHSWSRSAMAECAIADKPIVYPVVTTGLWGEAVRQRRPVITNDYAAANPLKKGYPQGHVAVKRHMNIPVFAEKRIVLVAGVGNKDEDYTDGDAHELTLLMEGMWRLIERKQSSEALQKSKNILDQTERIGKVGGWEFDIDTKEQAWTDEVYHIHEVDLAYKPTVENGINFYTPTSRPIIERAVQYAMEQGESFDVELEIITAKGNLRWVHAIGKADLEHRKVTGFFHDISDRKQSMERLKAEKANADAIFESSPVGMLILDETTKIVLANAAAITLCGGSNSDVLQHRPGNALRCIHSTKDPRGCGYSPGCLLCPARNGIEALLANGGDMHGAVLGLDLVRDGEPRKVWMEMGAEPIMMGGRRHLCVSMEDITERKLAEEEVVKYRDHLEELVVDRTKDLSVANERLKELDRLKGLFIASMSHELRTPLNSIIGFTGILLQGLAGPLNDEQKKQLGMVKISSKHLLALINDVIDVSKIEAEKIELVIDEFDLAHLIKEVYASFEAAAADKGLTLNIDKPDKIMITSDERRIKQIIMNLVSNAIKYTNNGAVKIALVQADGKIKIIVNDSGIGIRAKDMPRLFRQFGRIIIEGEEIREGTGLGLYLSQKLAGVLGGEITADSKFREGSEFTLILPVKYKRG